MKGSYSTSKLFTSRSVAACNAAIQSEYGTREEIPGTDPGTGTAYHPTTLPTVGPYSLPVPGTYLPGVVLDARMLHHHLAPTAPAMAPISFTKVNSSTFGCGVKLVSHKHLAPLAPAPPANQFFQHPNVIYIYILSAHCPPCPPHRLTTYKRKTRCGSSVNFDPKVGFDQNPPPTAAARKENNLKWGSWCT